MSALGFYAVDPASGNYVFGTPLFDCAVVQLSGNATLTVEGQTDIARRPLYSIRDSERQALRQGLVQPFRHRPRREFSLPPREPAQPPVRRRRKRRATFADRQRLTSTSFKRVLKRIREVLP